MVAAGVRASRLLLLICYSTGATLCANQKQQSGAVQFFGLDGESEAESEPADPCRYDSPEDSRLNKCLDRLRLLAADTGLYWFGDRWKSACSPSSNLNAASAIACYNPPKLQRYESLGARLLRVPTFDAAYLRNLDMFPRMIFTSPAGQYVGCDHVFRSDLRQEIHATPDEPPTPPWHLRKRPALVLPGGEEAAYVVVMVDVGFGDLYYLAYNYPSRTVVVREYSGPLNFRDSSNPVALLVFRRRSPIESIDWRSALEDDSSFNVQRFMIKNNLTQDWVGLNWVNVGTDGYAIEEQRRTGFVDNCPLLVRNRLVSSLGGVRLKFLPPSALSTLDTWMSIAYTSNAASFVLCCKRYAFEAVRVQLDPLGEKELRPVYVRNPPNVTAFRPSLPVDGEPYSYRRFGRAYVTVPDDGYYSLLMLDADAVAAFPLALWLVINIRGEHLREFTENKAGMTTLPYAAPGPSDDRIHRYVFLLFQQEGPIASFDLKHYTPDSCKTKYLSRCSFDVRELMARNGLTLRALNWVLSRRDEYVRYDAVRKGDESQKNLCRRIGEHYEEHCHPAPVGVVGADGRLRTNACSTTRRGPPASFCLIALAWPYLIKLNR